MLIDTIKPSEDDPNAVVIRMFESFGGGSEVRLTLKHGRMIAVDLADGLENPLCNLMIDPPEEGTPYENDSVLLKFKAFEVKTLLVRLFAM